MSNKVDDHEQQNMEVATSSRCSEKRQAKQGL